MNKILQAIEFATKKHQGQLRKDGATPYISHSLAVGVILSNVTSDEDIIIAGILHDILEDTDTTDFEIENLFNKNVSNLVLECTNKKGEDSKLQLKLNTLKTIKNLSKNAALIKCADILHNLYSLSEAIKTNGQSLLDKFVTRGQDKIEFEKNRLSEFKKYHKNTLINEIEITLNALESL